MNAPVPIELPVMTPSRTASWRRHLGALAAAALLILALFRTDAVAMARIWWGASTYNHCLFIAPLAGWLAWQRAPELERLTPRAWAPGLAVVALGGLGWLLGEAGGVSIARHAGLVVMIQGAAIACLGPVVSRGLAFPLFYLVFLIPAGEELVPPLQTLTARMCMGLLALARVPAHIDGVFITIPNGYYEVAEACSGVKFLVAMIAYGALVANTCFRSWRRRAIFMAACVIAPVLANGLRAWGTIYVGYLTDANAADSFDHVVYGWIFFGIVMLIVVGGAWRFFDRKPGDPWFDPAALEPAPPRASSPGRLAATLIAAIGIALAPIGWGALIEGAYAARLPARIALPQVPGWAPVPLSGVPWRPRFDGADLFAMGRYRDAAGRTIDLALIVYGHQGEGRELVGYGHGAVDPDGAWAWTSDTAPPANGRAERISTAGPLVREVASFYRVGNVTTGSPARVKIETLKARLLGGPQRAVALLVSAEEKQSGRPAIDAFLRALGPVDRIADAAAVPAR